MYFKSLSNNQNVDLSPQVNVVLLHLSDQYQVSYTQRTGPSSVSVVDVTVPLLALTITAPLALQYFASVSEPVVPKSVGITFHAESCTIY